MSKKVKWIIQDPKKKNVFWPSKEMKAKAWISDESIYKEAAENPEDFWSDKAKNGLKWIKKWSKIYVSSPPYFKWFVGGKLNACYNALDRHIESWRKNKAAIIWEAEPENEPNRVLTYHDLYREVNKFANVLKSFGIKKGDRVAIYLPMIPEVHIAMLACARLGAIHTVVFSAFSSKSLQDRLNDANAKLLVTADGYWRFGRALNLKDKADEGIKESPVTSVIVIKRGILGLDVNMVEGRDHWWHDLMKETPLYCQPEVMDSEDPLFILYTSGTTGKPKGIIHDTGGYLTQAYWTSKWNFDLHDEDVFWCTADVGWITGHTYGCYGPLTVGATQVMFEGVPNYPDLDRWWKIIEKYGVTIFYTAPTAIRMFMRYPDAEEWPAKHNLSSLRLLGTVGEPINEDAWMWYLNHIGGGICPIIDTWWQTETGGALINSLPGIGPFIPTVAGRSFPGTNHEVLDENGDPVSLGEGGYLVQRSPFAPGMLRGVYKNPKRYKDTYWSEYGEDAYFTSDGARIWDDLGNIRLTGRVDDVMKVSGHRLSTAEIENALGGHPLVAETAVVAAPHEIKGEVPIAFVILKEVDPSEQLKKELIKQVDQVIGVTARPGKIIFVEDLPKTRSGKIMRRILKSLVKNKRIGDITTLSNPEAIEHLKDKTGYND